MLCPYSSSGTTSAARPWIAMSTLCVFGVGSRLTSATRAPASLASEAKDAAGYTIPDVPMMSSTSHERTAEELRSRSTGSSDSPNHTMCGRSSPSHLGRSEEHTSELQSRLHLVCRLLLEKKTIRLPGLPDPACSGVTHPLTHLPPRS